MLKKFTSKASLLAFVMLLAGNVSLHAQADITFVGGNVENSTGSLSYSVGQLAVKTSIAPAVTVVNITESFTEGVQQPFTTRDVERYEGIPALDVRLAVYPNPTTDNVVLQCDQAIEQLAFVLYTVNGQVLQQGTFNGDQQTLDIQLYPAGTYMLHVSSADKSKMNIYKIIKAK